MANNEEQASSRAASVIMISSNDDTISESAAAQQSETTSKYQHSGESEEIAVGSLENPVSIDAPHDLFDETGSGGGPQTACVVGEAEKNGKKRAGEEHDQGNQAKKAKTGEEKGSAQGGEEAGGAKGKPDHEETFEEFKARARELDQNKTAKIKELKQQLQSTENELEQAQGARDEWRAEYLNLKKKDETRIAKKKEKEKSEKAHRNAVRAEDKKAIRADVEKEAREKFAKAEKRLQAQNNTKVNNMADDIEHKRKKIEDLTDELRDLKSDHKDEIRGLKEKLKEAQKEGGPKAIEKLKQKDLELKEKGREAQDWKRRAGDFHTTITRLNSEVNAAKTGEQQSQTALDNTFHDMEELQKDLAKAKREVSTWKANAMHANNNGEIREKQWKAEFKQTTENYGREVDALKHRADACNTWQKAARDLSRANERINEQHLHDVQKLADTQNKLQLALIEKDRAVASEETLMAEQQKLADDNKRLRDVLAHAKISPNTSVQELQRFAELQRHRRLSQS